MLPLNNGVPLANGASLKKELEPFVYTIKELSKQEKDLTKAYGNYNYGIEYTYSYFNLPEKIYGSYGKDADHMLGYFLSNKKSVGILISGNTGSGKSLTCKLLCNKAIAKGFPVIMVNGMVIDEGIIQYLATLDNCVIFLDEFGKLTHKQNQSILLQMLTDTNKRILWIFANKNKYEVHQEFFNRTERIRYFLEYKKITKEVVLEYCVDNQVDGPFIQLILERYKYLSEFSFDQLQGLVTEHLYAPHLSVEEITRLLNFKGLATEYKLVVKDPVLTFNDSEYEVVYKNSIIKPKHSDERITMDFFNQIASDRDLFFKFVTYKLEVELYNKQTEKREPHFVYLDSFSFSSEIEDFGFEDNEIKMVLTVKPFRTDNLVGTFSVTLCIEDKDNGSEDYSF